MTDEDRQAAATLERRARLKRLVISAPFLLIGGFIAYNVFDSYRSIREASQAKQCINHMRRFDEGLKAFEAAKKRAPQSPQEFADFALLAEFRCSAGGTYSVTRDEAGKAALACTEHGSLGNFAPLKHPHM